MQKSIKKDIEKYKNLLEAKEGEISLLKDALKNREDELLALKAELQLKNHKIDDEISSMKDKINKSPKHSLKHVIDQQNRKIQEFRGSIVYPLFRVTKKLGKTRLGKFLEKLMKGKK